MKIKKSKINTSLDLKKIVKTWITNLNFFGAFLMQSGAHMLWLYV